jgi:hypothetical protein
MDSKEKSRRRFLSDAGKYGALVAAGTSLPAPVALSEARAAAQTTDVEVGRDVKEKVEMLRIFGVMRRAPGLTNREIRGKGYIPLLAYGTRGLQEAMKSTDRRQALLFLQNFVNQIAIGAEGQSDCPSLRDRDFVSEYCMGIGKTIVGSVSGEIPPVPTDEPPPKNEPPAKGGNRAAPALPEYVEAGTDIRVAALQVLAEGKRPLARDGRDKGMHFIKMSSTVPAAERVKIWQDLHAKALAATPLFKNGLNGFELLQRVAGTPDRVPQRCGAEVAVPDLVACFWVKTRPASAQFTNYVRNLRKADTQNALDGPSSFLFLVEEWEVFMNPTFVP